MQAEILNIHHTRLSRGEVEDAEAAKTILREGGCAEVKLAELARDYVRRRPAVVDIPADEAIEAYRQALVARGTRPGYVRAVTDGLKHCWRACQAERVGELGQEDLEAWALEPTLSTATQLGRRAWLHGFYEWLLKSGRVAVNLAASIPKPKHRKALPAIFDVQACQLLLSAAAATAPMKMNRFAPQEPLAPGVMLPYVAVCLLSGVRPTEALRLDDWKYFDFTARHIEVPETVSKTRARFAPMHRNLRIILRVCKWRGLKPGFHSPRIFKRIRQSAGVDFPWNGPYNDVLRHTYASHRYALDKDMAALSHAMGNSPAELKRSYLRPVTAAQAKAFEGLVAGFRKSGRSRPHPPEV